MLQGPACSGRGVHLLHGLVCYRDYRSGEPLSYWRSTSGFEVDFVIGDHTAIELKAMGRRADVRLLETSRQPAAPRRDRLSVAPVSHDGR
jgi:hypothetical protein